jgi:hypothetical protein
MRHAAIASGALLIAVLLAGCGSGTQTVSVSSLPPAASTSATTTTQSTSTSRSVTTTSGTQSAQVSPSGGTAAGATRTAPGPASAEGHGPSTGGASSALAIVRAHGYTPGDPSEYHPNQTLQVLLGTRAGSGEGHGGQAFFFIGGRYLGTDTATPSGAIRVVSQSDTEVTLAYALYAPHDAPCCPSGGERTVRFALDNGRLAPLDAIPPASSTAGPSRR